jgi:hypothetical protein
VHGSARPVLDHNLKALPAAVRLRLSAEAAGPGVRTEGSGTAMQAWVEMADGREVPVHASAHPAAAAEEAFAQMASGGAPPLIIQIGAGLGFLLDAIERAGAPTRVIAFEAVPNVARAMLGRRDWSDWLRSGRLSIFVGPDYAGAAEAWRLFPAGVTAPPTLVSPLISREFPAEAASARALVGRMCAGVAANLEARRQFAGRYLLQTLANLPVICAEADAAALAGRFAGMPAVVVGAGPSLDGNLPFVGAVARHALVVAVDTALRPLLAAGIRPHLVVAVDPSELNGRHLRDLDDPRGVSLVAEASVDPRVFGAFAGRTFTFRVSRHEPWPWLESVGLGRGSLRAWGSVLTTAFDLAIEAGCDPIVFAGADLAYSRGLQYCRNTTYEPDWRDCPTDEARAARFAAYIARHPTVVEPGVTAPSVISTPSLVQFRDWIVSRAAEAAPRRTINATGDGILRGGPIETMTADEAGALVAARGRAAAAVKGVALEVESAWARSARHRHTSFDRLAAALASPASLPVGTWAAFAGGLVSDDAIAAAVVAARGSLAALTSPAR